MSYRKQQVESTLHRAISQVLSVRMSDPRIRGMVSVTSVDVSPDLHSANVGISVLPDTYQKRTLQGLRHASRHIQGKVFKQVKMRAVPQLNFQLDESLKRQAQVFAAIDDSIRIDREYEAQRSDAPEEARADTPDHRTTPPQGSHE